MSAGTDSLKNGDSREVDAKSREFSARAGTALGLAESDRLFLITVTLLIFLLMGIHLVRQAVRPGTTIQIVRSPERQLEFQIDINQAGWVEWMQLPEVGEGLARRIVWDRTERGLFTSVEDVDRVPGIGPLTMQKIRPYLKHGPPVESLPGLSPE